MNKLNSMDNQDTIQEKDNESRSEVKSKSSISQNFDESSFNSSENSSVEDMVNTKNFEISKLKQSQNKVPRCIWRHNNKWRVRWDLSIMMIAIYNCFVIPYEASFSPSENVNY